MDTLRSAAHLQRELGNDLFNALVSSDNTEAVRKFASELVKDELPTTMTIAGRTYEILDFLRGNEAPVPGDTMVERAMEMQAHLGQDDGQYLLDHQEEIPVALRRKVVFVFTDWRLPVGSGSVAFVGWSVSCWVRGWNRIDGVWNGNLRVLRRKSARNA